ncbi:MAG: PRD domain-containing protein, partial [Enterococcus sp.]|nr:PRD domain-containing protein [Enterococcus sp.]
QLAYAVKQLIEAVSQETEVNFFEDTNLYKMLLTHLSGVFSRAVLQEEDLTNPILERIMNQYQEIAAALRQALPQIFPQKNLSEEEIAYMVLHFANSLERSPKIMEVDIAGFSPSGLASTSMLEMRLRRYFPFINQIHFFRIADLGKVNVEENYDLVISTSLLPGYNGKYKLISPLLLDDEIRQLKEEFKRISHEKRSLRKAPVKKIGGEESYETVVAFMEEISKLLETFFIADLNNQADLAETVQQALAQLSADLITDSAIVCQQLMKRYEQAPIGIPQTEMALFHTSSTAVTQPVFCIFNLAQPLMIEGMDKKPMQLQRMLLMLAPMPIDETIGKILGKISGAIIMNDLNTEIFHSGNEAIVYQLLSSLLIEEMKG